MPATRFPPDVRSCGSESLCDPPGHRGTCTEHSHNGSDGLRSLNRSSCPSLRPCRPTETGVGRPTAAPRERPGALRAAAGDGGSRSRARVRCLRLRPRLRPASEAVPTLAPHGRGGAEAAATCSSRSLCSGPRGLRCPFKSPQPRPYRRAGLKELRDWLRRLPLIGCREDPRAPPPPSHWFRRVLVQGVSC